MADETGEPEGVAEVSVDQETKPSEDLGAENTESADAAELNTEENKAVVEINETEKTEQEQTNSDQKDGEPEKSEIDENNENIENKDNVDNIEDRENKEYLENKDNIETIEEGENKEQLENVENEQTAELGEEQKEKVKTVKKVDDTNLEEENLEEEHLDEEHAEVEIKPEEVTEEGIYEEIEEEIENEDGVKIMKKIKKKIKDPGELLKIETEEVIEEVHEEEPEVKEEEEKAAVPVEQEIELLEEEQMLEEPPPDPAAPLDFSDSKEAMKPPFHLRPDQHAELESLWELYQNYTPVYTDIDGYITEKELVYMLKSLLLMTYTVDQLHELITFVCRPPHPKGHINYEQFVKMVTLRQRDLNVEDELRNALKVMDFDNTGTVDREFFRDTLITKGNKMSNKMVDFLIKEVDISNDGELGIEDVVGTIAIDLNREDIEMLKKSIYPEEDIAEKEEEDQEDGDDNQAVEENDEDDDDDD